MCQPVAACQKSRPLGERGQRLSEHAWQHDPTCALRICSHWRGARRLGATDHRRDGKKWALPSAGAGAIRNGAFRPRMDRARAAVARASACRSAVVKGVHGIRAVSFGAATARHAGLRADGVASRDTDGGGRRGRTTCREWWNGETPQWLRAIAARFWSCKTTVERYCQGGRMGLTGT